MTSNSTKLSDTREKQCSRCGAALPAELPVCWLCFAPVETKAGSRDTAITTYATKPVHFASPGETAGGFSLASLMMFVTLLCVVLGVTTIAPGIGIPFGIIMLVAWLRTAAVARRRAAHGVAVTRLERLQLFVSSLATTITLLALTCVAGCAALVAACFVCLYTWEGLGANAPGAAPFGWIAAAIVAGAIGIPAMFWIVKLIDRRWRRDAGEE